MYEKHNNDKADKTSIPTALSQLTADSTHRLVTDTEKSKWNNIIQRITAKDIIELRSGEGTWEPDYNDSYHIGIAFDIYTNSSTRYTSIDSMLNKYIIPGIYSGYNNCNVLYINEGRIAFKKIEKIYSHIINGKDAYVTESIINITDSMIDLFSDSVAGPVPGISGLYLHRIYISICDYNTYVSRGGKFIDAANKTYYVGYRINYKLPN